MKEYVTSTVKSWFEGESMAFADKVKDTDLESLRGKMRKEANMLFVKEKHFHPGYVIERVFENGTRKIVETGYSFHDTWDVINFEGSRK